MGTSGSGQSPTDAGPKPCSSCGTALPEGFRFCGSCGTPVGGPPPAPAETQPAAAPRPTGKNKKTLFFAAIQEARAKLVLIKGDGDDGVSFSLAGQEHLAGRGEVPLAFSEDPFMSPVHANFFYKGGKLLVRDEDSANGVYIRIRGQIPIEMGACFLVGEQVLQVLAPEDDSSLGEASSDGTYFFASPHKSCPFRLVQLLRGGDTGLAFEADQPTVTLGRDDNDINFPDDPFISGHHAHVSIEGDKLHLSDLGSKNGTFLRITNEHELQHGDYVFMGQQLLRVEIV